MAPTARTASHVLPVFHRRQVPENTDGVKRTLEQQGNTFSTARRDPDVLCDSGSNSCRTSISEEQGLEEPEDSEQWHVLREAFSHMPPGAKTCFQRCLDLVVNHDNTTCQVHREEIDTLLVFAGLFSGVLTAFIIESYKWLMVQSDDIMADYLRQMLAVMSHVEVSSVTTTTKMEPLPADVMARINGFWFSSLTLSLSSALIGIVSKQWLREYLRDTGHSYKTNLAVRQVKYEGFSHWSVGTIISAIPLLLQTALFLFLLGIMDLLWHIQTSVAAAITTFCSSTMLFFIVTTILPGIQFLCHHRRMRLHVIYQLPFKSPQALLFMRAMIAVANFFAWAYAYAKSLKGGSTKEHVHVAPYQTYEGWTQFDLDWTRRRDLAATWHNEPSALARCLGFMELTFEHGSLRDWIWNCLWDVRDRAVDAKYVLRCFRRDSQQDPDLSFLDDRLIQDVKAYLDPRGDSRPTSEAILYSLLETGRGAPRVEARLEHIIRIFNSFNLREGISIPQKIYDAVQNALGDLGDTSCSSEMRLQLFLVAQSLIQKGLKAESDLPLVSAIVHRLTGDELQDNADNQSELSLDLVDDVMEWLEEHPTPERAHDWINFKSRVTLAAQVAVVFAKRLVQADFIEDPAQHPRFKSIYRLVQLAYEKALSIPAETASSWMPEGFNMEELTLVKVSLTTPRDASHEVAECTKGNKKRTRSSKRACTDSSDGTLTQTSSSTSPTICSSNTTRGTPGDPLTPRPMTPPSMFVTDSKVVHWNAMADSEGEGDFARSTTSLHKRVGSDEGLLSPPTVDSTAGSTRRHELSERARDGRNISASASPLNNRVTKLSLTSTGPEDGVLEVRKMVSYE